MIATSTSILKRRLHALQSVSSLTTCDEILSVTRGRGHAQLEATSGNELGGQIRSECSKCLGAHQYFLSFWQLPVGINDLQKDAFYITVTTSSTSEHQPGFLLVSKLRLRWALMTQSQVVPLKETNPNINHGELRRFLSRIKFIDFTPKVRWY